jgi:hypothetical protein
MNFSTRLTFCAKTTLAFHSSSNKLFCLANECSLVLARALGLPTASFWGFGYQGGEVIIIREIILDTDYLIKYFHLDILYSHFTVFNTQLSKCISMSYLDSKKKAPAFLH